MRLPRALTPVDKALPAFEDVKHRGRAREPCRIPGVCLSLEVVLDTELLEWRLYGSKYALKRLEVAAMSENIGLSRTTQARGSTQRPDARTTAQILPGANG